MARRRALLLALVLALAGCLDDSSPGAEIVSPGNGHVTEGEAVEFIGREDCEMCDITEYEWSSSIDGIISSNASFTTDVLSVGNHTIDFRVQNENGEWSASATIWLKVDPRPPAITLRDSAASDGTWRVNVVKVNQRQDLDHYRFDLQDENNVTQYQGEIAIQNNSGLIDGIESEETWDEKHSGEDDTDPGRRAHDVERETDTCQADNETNGHFPVVFYDNDRDDRLTAGDQFTVRGSEYDGNYTVESGWKFVLRYHTGGISGEQELT